jgi:hypothetical protein
MSDFHLFSYKMTHDTGFAPNPFFNILTIATCKPMIRKYKQIGDWIAGFTSKKLNDDEVGKEKLVFLMQITEKITFEEYWNNEEYENKKPCFDKEYHRKHGDNIYIPERQGKIIKYVQGKTLHHKKKENIKKDLSGKFVLISNNFYYFGSKPLVIPDNIRPNIPKGQSAHGYETKDQVKAKEFVEFIKSNYKTGMHGHPHKWDEKDDCGRRNKC